MTDREKKLGLIVLVMVAGWGAWNLWGKYSGALDERKAELQAAEVALQDARFDTLKADATTRRLARYQERSLPVDPQVAQLEYRAWLVSELREAGLDFEDVTLSEKRPSGDAFTSLAYTAKAEGDLTALTKFLHAFYQAPQLHKITRLRLTPREGDQLQVDLSVQSLAISGAERKEGLPQGESGRLALESLDDYLASITERNVFTAYVPPQPPKPKITAAPVVKREPAPKPKFDDAAHAYLTGVVQAGERLQAWIYVRTTGETLRVYEGDPLTVGLLEGKVESISPKKIVVRVDENLYATPLGSHLREAAPLESEDVVF